MTEVFVSYKSEDRDRVRPIVGALQSQGFDVWWDAQIGVGEHWRETIETELGRARCVIVVWSKASTGPEGRFVRDEATRAQKRGCYLPVMIDAVDLPLGFGEAQAISLAGWRGDESDPKFQALTAALRTRLAGRPAEAPPALLRHRFAIDRRTALIGGGGVAVAAGLAAIWAAGAGRAPDGVAVLPFANLSGDPAQAYFSEGIAEEIRTALARIPALKVIGRVSSEAVRDLDSKEMARKLGVGSLLIGAVRRAGDTVRVTTQLIDGRTGQERWSDAFDGPLSDALALQAGIATRVAEAMQIKLDPALRSAFEAGGTRKAEAHDLYLRSLSALRNSFDPGELRAALDLLDQAVAADPSYAEAHAARARTLLSMTNYLEGTAELQATLSQAEAAADRAVKLEPRAAEAYNALALAAQYRVQPAAAWAAFLKSYALAPSEPRVLGPYSRFLIYLGRSDEALPLVAEYDSRDPLDPRRAFLVGYSYELARKPDLALQTYERAERLGLARGILFQVRAESLIKLGRPGDALAMTERITVRRRRLSLEAIAAARTGDRARSDRAMSELAGVQATGRGAYQLAIAHSARGEPDQAVVALQRAWRQRDPDLIALKVDPFLDPLRRDARFAALQSAIRFPA